MPTKVTDRKCPACGEKIDTTTCLSPGETDRIPESGDITICVWCQTFLFMEKVEGDERWMRELREEEVAELSDDDRITLMRVRKILEGADIEKARKRRDMVDEIKVKADLHLSGVFDPVEKDVKEKFGDNFNVILMIQERETGLQMMITSKMSAKMVLEGLTGSLQEVSGMVDKMKKDFLKEIYGK